MSFLRHYTTISHILLCFGLCPCVIRRNFAAPSLFRKCLMLFSAFLYSTILSVSVSILMVNIRKTHYLANIRSIIMLTETCVFISIYLLTIFVTLTSCQYQVDFLNRIASIDRQIRNDLQLKIDNRLFFQRTIRTMTSVFITLYLYKMVYYGLMNSIGFEFCVQGVYNWLSFTLWIAALNWCLLVTCLQRRIVIVVEVAEQDLLICQMNKKRWIKVLELLEKLWAIRSFVKDSLGKLIFLRSILDFVSISNSIFLNVTICVERNNVLYIFKMVNHVIPLVCVMFACCRHVDGLAKQVKFKKFVSNLY